MSDIEPRVSFVVNGQRDHGILEQADREMGLAWIRMDNGNVRMVRFEEIDQNLLKPGGFIQPALELWWEYQEFLAHSRAIDELHEISEAYERDRDRGTGQNSNLPEGD